MREKWGLAVKRMGLLLIMTLYLSVANGQRRENWPKPPEPAMHDETTQTPQARVEHRDLSALENDARELEGLAQMVPNDVTSMKKGLMPKEAVDRLKRIEKLAKKMRSEMEH
ncbi:MAG TPA: hypothetical protein VHR84_05015 [Terriglobales bacterium]|jgi:hypothetical protein|nr:hypothetical protein [Terriglobales bacterium]